jgi:hypothetical protein
MWDYSRVQEKSKLHRNLGIVSMFDELLLCIVKEHTPSPLPSAMVHEVDEEILDVIPVPVICIDREKPSPLNIFNYGLEISIVFHVVPLVVTDCVEKFAQQQSQPQLTADSLTVETTVHEDDSRLIFSAKTSVSSQPKWSVRASALMKLISAVVEGFDRNEQRVRSMIRTLKRVAMYLISANRHFRLTVSHLTEEAFELLEFSCNFAFYSSLAVSEEMQMLLKDGLILIHRGLQQQYHRSLRPCLHSMIKKFLPYVKIALPIVSHFAHRPLEVIDAVSRRLEAAHHLINH